ncbi:MAG: hypothetical protein K9M45_00580 [Kiritimatiellales bacterium]|nr:hypothetical protein [Kiritimatiellales bacterium]
MKKNTFLKTATALFLFALCSPLYAMGPRVKPVVIENDQLRVAINPVGAALTSIQGRDGKEFLWQGDPDYWAGQAPIMFPVNVRFKNERFIYNGRIYHMPRMGLAVTADFKLPTPAVPHEAVFEFRSTPEILKQNYPFPFRLLVKYSLEGSKLINEFTVTNEGSETMHFALGAHPGIRCPLTTGAERKDYQISFFESVTTGRNKIDDSLFYDTMTPYLKDEDALNLADKRIPDGGMFLKDSRIRRFGIGRRDQPPYTTVDLGNFPNVNIWTPPGMPFVCIEPMVSHHDRADAPFEIDKKAHLIALPPGNSKIYSFSIEIHGPKPHPPIYEQQ